MDSDEYDEIAYLTDYDDLEIFHNDRALRNELISRNKSREEYFRDYDLYFQKSISLLSEPKFRILLGIFFEKNYFSDEKIILNILSEIIDNKNNICIDDLIAHELE